MANGDTPTSAQGTGPETSNGRGSIFLQMLDGILSVAKSLYEANAQANAQTYVNGAGAPGDAPHSSASFSTSGSAGAISNYITSNLSTYGTYSMTWEDPSIDIINTIRELMFRSAIAQSDDNPSAVSAQGLTATETKFISIYRSHYNYLGLAIGCLSIEVIVIALLLVGWHRLGRSFSTDALEIARAFGAPFLQKGSSNDTIGNLMRRVGRKRVRYGQAGYEVRPEEPDSSAEEFPPDELLQTEGHNDEAGVLGQERTTLVGHEVAQAVKDGRLQERCKLEFNTEDRVGVIERGVLY
ncbi:hypothetical protein CcaCcLH18_09591 [Colletotrichum camelliae]|nr:hypothetical protein CcaCcLH18_09591 [Colletotrichum camelliae]